jgi:hypothetical protein
MIGRLAIAAMLVLVPLPGTAADCDQAAARAYVEVAVRNLAEPFPAGDDVVYRLTPMFEQFSVGEQLELISNLHRAEACLATPPPTIELLAPDGTLKGRITPTGRIETPR